MYETYKKDFIFFSVSVKKQNTRLTKFYLNVWNAQNCSAKKQKKKKQKTKKKNKKKKTNKQKREFLSTKVLFYLNVFFTVMQA